MGQIRPELFLAEARGSMSDWVGQHLDKAGADSFSRMVAVRKNPDRLEDPRELRTILLDFIADFADWDNSADPDYLATARAMTRAAHRALGGESDSKPLVVDPFSGGGAIPLEALRLDADVVASDLNPVAILLNKVVLEYVPRHGQRLADEVRKWGEWMRVAADEELVDVYPKDPDDATPIVYLWGRRVRCTGPGCGATYPLIKSLQFARKAPGWHWTLEASPEGDIESPCPRGILTGRWRYGQQWPGGVPSVRLSSRHDGQGGAGAARPPQRWSEGRALARGGRCEAIWALVP